MPYSVLLATVKQLCNDDLSRKSVANKLTSTFIILVRILFQVISNYLFCYKYNIYNLL